MSNEWIFVVGLLVVLAIVCGLYMRRERQVMRLMAGVADQLGSLRSEMVATGTAERAARLPSPPKRAAARNAPSSVPRLPSVERGVVSVTRDDDPVHTRATVAGWPAPANDREQSQRSGVAGTALAAVDHRTASAGPKSETTGQMRAQRETQEDEREAARRRGGVEELPKLSADRSSDAETSVFSAARVSFRLAEAAVGEDDSTHVTPPRKPLPLPAPVPVVPNGDAESWDDTDELMHIAPHETPVADTQAPGVPALRLAGSMTRRPPHTPPRRATVVDGERAGGSQRPPAGAVRAPLPPLAATLSRARVDDDERPTIEAPAPAQEPGGRVDLATTRMPAHAVPSPASLSRPAEPKLAADVAYQFSLRIGRAAQRGQNVAHCGGPACTNDPAGVCACACDRCRSRRQVLAHVRLDVLGPTPAQRHAARVRHAQLVAELHQKGNVVAHCNRAACCPESRERPSEVDTRLLEETCVCSCAGCVDMRTLLKRAFGQIAEAAVT